MELYDIVLPFIYHDAFRKEILKHDTLKDVIEASIEADPHFKEVILEAINDDEGITSKALGMAMMGGRTIQKKKFLIYYTRNFVLSSCR